MSDVLQDVDFSWPCRVYYEDTDGQGFLYHSRCMNFFERARTEWVRSVGIAQSQWLAQRKGFVVSDAALKYHKPAFLDDALVATVRIIKVGRARISLAQDLVRVRNSDLFDGTIVSGQFTIAFVDLEKQKPLAMPAQMIKSLAGS